MQLDHEFTVPVPVAQAWPILLDVERIAPCMPGATVTKVDGQNVEGTVKVKVGPVTVTYGGSATFLETDEVARRVVIEARGRETRGSGTASARVTTQMFDAGDSTRVTVSTDLSITGKPAQFGRGVMSDVGAKLLGQFADCLSQELGTTQAAAAPAVPAAAGAASGGAGPASVPDASGAGPRPRTGETGITGTPGASANGSAQDRATDAAQGDRTGGRPSAEAIDLLDAAGGAVLKRVIPALAALAVLGAAVAILLRRRSQR